MRPPERTRIRVSPGAPALLAVFVWLSSPEVLGAVLLAALCHELGHYAALRRRGIMWLDVAIFQIAVLLGFWVTWAMLRRRALASPVWQVAGAAVLAAVWAAFILWTFAPPDLPLFADPETGLRGIR